jgi:stress-induced-phosphoprotein 1
MSNPAKALEYKEQGNKHLAAKKYAKAIESYTKGLEQDATSHVLYSNRSGAYVELGRWREAEQDARRCIEIAPRWAKGHYRLGAALEGQHQYAEAAAAYRAAVNMDPDNAELLSCAERMEKKHEESEVAARPSKSIT